MSAAGNSRRKWKVTWRTSTNPHATKIVRLFPSWYWSSEAAAKRACNSTEFKRGIGYNMSDSAARQAERWVLVSVERSDRFSD